MTIRIESQSDYENAKRRLAQIADASLMDDEWGERWELDEAIRWYEQKIRLIKEFVKGHKSGRT